MSHPQVAEAVAFGCPDEKYGEIVAAAVVPTKPVSDTAAFAKDIQKQAAQKLAAFKVMAFMQTQLACKTPHLGLAAHLDLTTLGAKPRCAKLLTQPALLQYISLF